MGGRGRGRLVLGSLPALLPQLERDVDFDGDFHGKTGPIPIRRIRDAAMSPFVKAVSKTLEARGYPKKPDQNGRWEDGVYVGAIAVGDDGRRVPTSVAYLTPEVRRRPNLEIVTEHLAEKLVIESGRATGAIVVPAAGGAARTIAADEVVVASGAIHTPALLMRSGIGPADAMRRHGIAVVADRRGVGQNLMEHPSTAVSTYLPKASRLGDLDEHHDHAILRFSSGLEGTPQGDMHMAMIARSGWHSVGPADRHLVHLGQQGLFARLGRARLGGRPCRTRGRFRSAVRLARHGAIEDRLSDRGRNAD